MPVSRQDLVAALQRTARGDRAAFRLVYEATSLKLYGIVVRILGRRDLADEVLQEVYVRVWQRAGDFDTASGSPITWLAAIARNLALDEVRRKTPRSIEDFPEILQLPSESRWVGGREEGDRAAGLLLRDDAGGDREPHQPSSRYREDVAAPQPRTAQGLSWSMTEEDDIDGLAAEYVLGSLDPAERAQVDARRKTDAPLAAAVEAWERRLGPLNEQVAGIEPPAVMTDCG